MGNKKIYIIIAVLVTLLLIVKVKQNKQVNQEVGLGTVSIINSQQFDELAREENVFIVDVHTPEQKHIPGTDAFIPYDIITNDLSKLPEDKETTILVYCRSGSMSAIAADKLVEAGYTKVYDLEGGINAYRESHVEVTVIPEMTELGTVIYGDIAQARATLTNFTPNKFTITSISGSCACTTAVSEKMVLEPYESSEITISFNPGIHKDNSDLGDIIRTVFIETDNPNFPQVEVSFKAYVVKNE